MCRMGFVSLYKDGNITNHIRNSSVYYSNRNGDGFGYIFNESGGITTWVKFGGTAFNYWSKNKDTNIISSSLVYHCRNATSQDTSSKSAHPFIDENNEIAIAHNGVLYDYDSAKKYLQDKGYNFNTEVDSELLLYSYIEWGDDFIKKLDEMGVRGSINLLIYQFDGTVKVYSDDGSFKIVKTEEGYYGASDDETIDYLGKTEEIKSGHLVTFKKGKIVEDKDIGTLSSKYNYNYSYGYQYKIGSTDLNSMWGYEDWSGLDNSGFDNEFTEPDDDEQDTEIDKPVFDSVNNNYFISELAYKTYKEDPGISGLRNKYIDDEGNIFNTKEEFEEGQVYITKAKYLINTLNNNKFNLRKRGLYLLSDGSILDSKTGVLYEDFAEYERVKRFEDNRKEEKRTCQ